VRGLIKNWTSLNQINLSNFDILLLNEIWKVNDYEHLLIEDFKLAHIIQRNHSRGGGTAIFVRKELNYEIIPSPFQEGTIETSACKINNTVFCSLYRPPQGSKDVCTDTIIEWIESLRNQNVFVAGDWNINMLTERDRLETIENSTNTKFKINNITRIASGTCIDNILTNMEGLYKVSNICIADHQGLEAKINITCTKKPKEKFKYREMKECNWQKFKNEIEKISVRGRETEDKWNNLIDDIRIAVNLSFPIKERNQQYKFTMSQGLLKSKNKKNRLLRQYRRGEIQKEVYTKYNKIYRKLIHTEKENDFHKKLLDAGTNTKQKWKVLKDELKITAERELIDEIQHGDEIITSKKDIAEIFKHHFQTCAEDLARNIPNRGDCNILMEQEESWAFQQVTELELIKIIDSIKPKSSSGFDCLSNRMLKMEKHSFAKLLTPLINRSILEGVFPSVLKVAKVIAIHKKGDKKKLNNYRPISLLPVVSKVFEKVINQQITKNG